ncbi:unnamed protein product [Didymodactylos carnosus]|uniref:Uncharacterized protein n=1 Tax=Didymodactylos carnosus TaxID=1234261 RepID=A0A814DWS6_9BILA|nr:unnamed protein product [Didymodactylos carnosus]CAF3737214.1 unnamed protein product [Didymodactylos carnosus]
MSDSTLLPTVDPIAVESAAPKSNLISQESAAAQSQFLTVAYNPAAHPRQISLLDTNGQPVQYTLIPSNQHISLQSAPQLQSYNMAAMPMNVPPHANACSVCGSPAVDKCSYGISYGRPCSRLLCLSHIMELPGVRGGRYPHCPEHYQQIQQNKLCNVM